MEMKQVTKPTLVQELLQLFVAVAFLFFALFVIARMAGMGEKALKHLGDTILEAIARILALPFKAIIWLLKKFFQ